MANQVTSGKGKDMDTKEVIRQCKEDLLKFGSIADQSTDNSCEQLAYTKTEKMKTKELEELRFLKQEMDNLTRQFRVQERVPRFRVIEIEPDQQHEEQPRNAAAGQDVEHIEPHNGPVRNLLEANLPQFAWFWLNHWIGTVIILYFTIFFLINFVFY